MDKMLLVAPKVAKTSKYQTHVVITINHLHEIPQEDIVRLLDQRVMYDLVSELGFEAEDWSTGVTKPQVDDHLS